MSVFRQIFPIIFAPFRLLDNFLRHKDNLLELHLNYGPSFVKIKTIHKDQFMSDDLLIASYVLFLGRYFYICNDRQTDVIRDFLGRTIGNGNNDIKELSAEIFATVVETLNPMEQHAVEKLFFMGIPPLVYSEGEEPIRSYAKYVFLVFKKGEHLTSTFHMSMGPDIVFLPLTVAILYEFVVDKLGNKNKKQQLDGTIIDLLEAHNQFDCRSLYALSTLPVEFLIKNNITY